MRSKRHIFRFLISLLFLILLPVFSVNAGHGDSVREIGKISTNGLIGFNLWFVNLYNDHRFLFAMCTLFVMGIIGIIIAYITEYLLKLIGMEATKMEHKE